MSNISEKTFLVCLGTGITLLSTWISRLLLFLISFIGFNVEIVDEINMNVSIAILGACIIISTFNKED